MKSCTICDKPVIARGWCSSHYNRWWRHGSPTAGRVSPGLSLATLTTWVKERHRGDCWKWLWAENGVGYGVVNVNGRQGLATHFALLLDGQAPSSNGLCALHSCDNPPCVNPDHLRWGTHSDNMQDRIERGRSRTDYSTTTGEKSVLAKLTNDQVYIIRSLSDEGWTRTSLAERFGIGISQVSRIAQRQSWVHLPEIETTPA